MIQEKHFSGKFLYVGRLAPEKNLIWLLEVFSKNPQWHLTIIGQGPLQKELESLKSDNVTIRGHIPNELLAREYQQHDIFILPSLREPWGLVVEEALFYGLPVIASNQVGCAQDLIANLKTGALFSVTDSNSLTQALHWTIENYQACVEKVAQVDFHARDAYQVQQYIEAQS
jgi:glycosyltransferase involved in cell wall biosynthesis